MPRGRRVGTRVDKESLFASPAVGCPHFLAGTTPTLPGVTATYGNYTVQCTTLPDLLTRLC